MNEESTGGAPIQAVADKMRKQMRLLETRSVQRITMTSQQAAMQMTRKVGGKAVAVRKVAKRALR